MIVVLRNEPLFKSGKTEIYKTFNPQLGLYGLYLPKQDYAKKYKAIFLHIFKYENGKAAVVTQNEEYKWINLNWKISPMTEAEEYEWSSYIIKNDLCLCHDFEELRRNCKLCHGYGQLENPFADRQLNKFFGLD